MVGAFPEMEILTESDTLYKKTISVVNQSFVKEVIDLYIMAQNYLKNRKAIKEIEPVYLALTKKQGGFAKTGFYLLQNGAQVDKTKTYYVDIIEGSIVSDVDRLMSFTQLYPHELGHNFLKLLSIASEKTNYSRNVQMHYFGIVTDYPTAFNEGFAEHFENASRLNEKNEQIKTGIFNDIENYRTSLNPKIKGFQFDFKLPFRLDFYQSTMLLWYQKLENLKRFDLAENGNIRFKNLSFDSKAPERVILFRNAGVQQDTSKLRNLVQMLSTEGVVSAFFTKMIQSDLKNNYLDTMFYKRFLSDSLMSLSNPKSVFTPLQNQYLKTFVVLYNYVKLDRTDNSQLTDFIDGYSIVFPAEKNDVKKIFKDVTRLEYTNELPREIWLLTKDVKHTFWVMDQFGLFARPIHTFNLNAAEVEDLLMINGVSKEEAEKIIEYRNIKGQIKNLDELKKITGVSGVTAQRIMLCDFDQEYFDKQAGLEFNMFSIIWSSLRHIFLRWGIYFAIMFALSYFFIYRKQKLVIKEILVKFVKKLGYWFIFLIAAVVCVVFFSHPLLYFIPSFIVISGLNFFFNRKDRQNLLEGILTTAAMGIIMVYSLF